MTDHRRLELSLSPNRDEYPEGNELTDYDNVHKPEEYGHR